MAEAVACPTLSSRDANHPFHQMLQMLDVVCDAGSGNSKLALLLVSLLEIRYGLLATYLRGLQRLLELLLHLIRSLLSFQGDWNGASAHTNYSTNSMRNDGGYEVIKKATEKLGLRHTEYIAAYGEGNERRLTGGHETAQWFMFCLSTTRKKSTIELRLLLLHMAAFNIQETLIWKEKIDIKEHNHQMVTNIFLLNTNRGWTTGRQLLPQTEKANKFSAQEDEDDPHPNLLRRTTIGNGPPESVFDWTREIDSDLSNQNINNQAFSRKHWRLLQCQNGLRIFEELLEIRIRSLEIGKDKA